MICYNESRAFSCAIVKSTHYLSLLARSRARKLPHELIPPHDSPREPIELKFHFDESSLLLSSLCCALLHAIGAIRLRYDRVHGLNGFPRFARSYYLTRLSFLQLQQPKLQYY
jgi:hypothetical protein